MSIYSQENSFYVYQYLRKNDSKNGKAGTPYYIGKGKNGRAYQKHPALLETPARNRITIICKNMNEADAFQLEMLLIHLHGRIDLGTGCLRNLTIGGDGISGYKHLAETKKKISNATKGKKDTAETRARKSVWQKGRPKNRNKNLPAWNKGLHHKLETKEKISNSLKDKTRPEFSLTWKKNIGKATTERSKNKEYMIALANKISDGVIRSRKDCPNCGRNINLATFNRCHGEKCKLANSK